MPSIVMDASAIFVAMIRVNQGALAQILGTAFRSEEGRVYWQNYELGDTLGILKRLHALKENFACGIDFRAALSKK